MALTETFIDLGDLDNPKKGRMKFVLEAQGAAAFRAAWLARFDRVAAATSYQPEPIEVPDALRLAEIMAHRPDGGWSAAVRPQRTPGLALVTVNVPLGDLSGDELRVLADLAALGDGHLYTTRNQNVQYRDVPVARVGELGEALGAVGLGLAGADSSVDVRACTGSAVVLAITAAPSAGARIAASPLLARNGSLRVHVSGCPNSCAQHQAADIGLSGQGPHQRRHPPGLHPVGGRRRANRAAGAAHRPCRGRRRRGRGHRRDRHVGGPAPPRASGWWTPSTGRGPRCSPATWPRSPAASRSARRRPSAATDAARSPVTA